MLIDNPKTSMTTNALDYFSLIFHKCILEKDSFEFWDVKNSDKYEHWPDAVKMDHFLEMCWTKRYDNELTFLYR